MLLGWERDELTAEQEDNAHVRWQAALWRRLSAGGRPRHLARWFTEAIEKLEEQLERVC